MLLVPGFGMNGASFAGYEIDLKADVKRNLPALTLPVIPLAPTVLPTLAEQAHQLEEMIQDAMNNVSVKILTGFSLGGDLIMEMTRHRGSNSTHRLLANLPSTTELLLLEPNVSGSETSTGTCFITEAAFKAKSFDEFESNVRNKLNMSLVRATQNMGKWDTYFRSLRQIQALFTVISQLGGDVKRNACERFEAFVKNINPHTGKLNPTTTDGLKTNEQRVHIFLVDSPENKAVLDRKLPFIRAAGAEHHFALYEPTKLEALAKATLLSPKI